jgi:hypothetical protein
VSACKGEHCTAEIDWAVRPDGKQRHPFTRPAPCPGPGEHVCTHSGNFALWFAGGRAYYRPLRDGEHLTEREHRAVSHYATCPDAAEFRCPRCKHKPHAGNICTRLGPVTCRRVAVGNTAVIARGRFECGCTEGVIK